MYMEKLEYKGNYLRADDWHDEPLKVNLKSSPMAEQKSQTLRLGYHKDIIAMDKIEAILQLAFAFYKKQLNQREQKSFKHYLQDLSKDIDLKTTYEFLREKEYISGDTGITLKGIKAYAKIVLQDEKPKENITELKKWIALIEE